MPAQRKMRLPQGCVRRGCIWPTSKMTRDERLRLGLTFSLTSRRRRSMCVRAVRQAYISLHGKLYSGFSDLEDIAVDHWVRLLGFEPGAAVDERAVGAAEVFDIKLAAARCDSRVASRDARRRVIFREVDVGPDTSMRVDAPDGDFVFRR